MYVIFLQENRLASLQKQYEKTNNRLNSLFDLRLDREVNEGTFKTKESEYNTQLIELKAQIANAKAVNPNFYENGCKTLELSNRLYSMYVKANYGEKAKILKAVASNYTINDVTIAPTYGKPFSLFAKRASRPNWLRG